MLLHPTSLPGSGYVGTIGSAAYRFVDWLAETGQSAWQILPLVPVGSGGSPYNGLSAMAGNPLLVDYEPLVRDGLLRRDQIPEPTSERSTRVQFADSLRLSDSILADAFHAFRRLRPAHLRGAFERYREENAGWLEDYALFRAVRVHHDQRTWTDWEPAIRDRAPAAMRRYHDELRDLVERQVFAQFIFHRQWSQLRQYARGRGVRLIGDLPIFVAHDSADVWANRDLFELDAEGQPTAVAGVPPDYFSETGQRWGNPLYRWDVMESRGYSWWIERFRRTFEWVDVVRVDHFRGFAAYWSIPAGEPTAIGGDWKPGPGDRVFNAVREALGELPIIAEDLGLITPDVDDLRERLGLPGMRVLQFAFDGDPENPHLPENFTADAVAYTGTHDNDTLAGWWDTREADERERIQRLIPDDVEPIAGLVEVVWRSAANLAVAPMQDVLGLGSESRMNTPGTSDGNWSWRMAEMPRPETTRWLRRLTSRTGRARRTGTAEPHHSKGMT